MKISVVTATWNCDSTISDCLESFKEQTYVDKEHIVVDGYSTDRTVEILRDRRNQLAVLISEKDDGIYDALNKGISRATGDVVGFLHADDIFADTDVLSRVAAAFSDPSVCAVYGDLVYVSQGDVSRVVRYWKSNAFRPRALSWGWMPPHPTLYVRREWYSRIGAFDTRYRISADYYSILRLFSSCDFKAEYIPSVLVKMRLGGESNRSLSNIVRKSSEDLDALRRAGVGAFGGYGALIWKNISKLLQFYYARQM